VLDLKTGNLLGEALPLREWTSSLTTRSLHIFYLCAESATIAIVAISTNGAAKVLKTADTVEGAHCVTVDDRGQVYVCDPVHGKVLVFKDSLTH